MKEIDFDGLAQPKLSPRMLRKIADTFQRKIGRRFSEDDALAWWNWVWPNFESYWRAKKYRNISRAILGWASRVQESEIAQAREAARISSDLELQDRQDEINENSESSSVVKIDYFSRLGGKKS